MLYMTIYISLLSEKDKLKETLIDSYFRLGKAQATVLETRAQEEGDTEGLPAVSPEDMKETYETLQQWIDLNDSKVYNSVISSHSTGFCRSYVNGIDPSFDLLALTDPQQF